MSIGHSHKNIDHSQGQTTYGVSPTFLKTPVDVLLGNFTSDSRAVEGLTNGQIFPSTVQASGFTIPSDRTVRPLSDRLFPSCKKCRDQISAQR